MPIQKFEIVNKNDSNKTVQVSRYVIDSTVKATGVLFGKFIPWTGPLGHGRLLKKAQTEFGKDNVIIVSPERKEKDPEIDIFTDDQKKEIINRVLPSVKFYRIPHGSIPMMFRSVVELGYKRPVFVIGPDRIEDFSKYLIKYDSDNMAITDTEMEDFGKGEYFALKDRGKNGTSGTQVRETLVNDDMETFIELTGYDEDMWDFLQERLKENKFVENTIIAHDFEKYYFGDGVDD